jgi:hypothetical protein
VTAPDPGWISIHWHRSKDEFTRQEREDLHHFAMRQSDLTSKNGDPNQLCKER